MEKIRVVLKDVGNGEEPDILEITQEQFKIINWLIDKNYLFDVTCEPLENVIIKI